MSASHEGQVVVVTGAGKGIGRAIAERFAGAGASVVVNDLESSRVDDVVASITAAGGTAVGGPADVSDSAQVEALFDTAVEAFGTVDVLVNNAGMVSPMLHFFEADEAWWRRIIDVNLTGHFLCSHRAARIMAANGAGVIINMSSGSPGRPSGMFSPRRRRAASSMPSVSMEPGINAHTRMPYGPRSRAMARVRASMPPLEAS